MKKILAILLASLFILSLVSCGEPNVPQGGSAIVDGFYLLPNNNTEYYAGAYLSLDADSHMFQSGPGLAMDIAYSGDFEIEGDRLTVHESLGGDSTLEFRVISETELELTSIDVGQDGNFIAYWLNIGDVYHFVDLPLYGDPPEKLFNTVDPADDAMAKAIMGGAVAFKDMRLYSGQETWNEFAESVESGEPAEVLCAKYYTLDKDRMSEELYEEEKDEYPRLYYYLVEFDGEKFKVTVRKSDEQEAESTETFACMNHYEGEAPQTAAFSRYEYYVLVDDPDITWEDIEEGMVSSQAGAWIEHCAVYQSIWD